MKKILLAPDSFKGTLSAIEVCRLIKARVQAHFPKAQVVSVPLADGGEGMADCFLYALGGQRVHLPAASPLGTPVDAYYGILPGGMTAVIEMAAAAGLSLAGENKRPDTATTYGVGELIADALRRGCTRILVGLGGSATNDGGCGAAAALGAVFLNAAGEPFVPVGGTLDKIAKIDLSGLNPALPDCALEVLCDVDCPLYGERGAALVFSPQKGADADMARMLDAQLRALSKRIEADLGVDVSEIPDAGAAGGMGAGMLAFLGARLVPGIETVLDIVGFDNMLSGADLVITGEGRLDSQSLHGKAVSGVAHAAKARGVPVVVLAGDIDVDMEALYAFGVTAALSTNRRAVPYGQAKLTCADDLSLTADTLMRLLRLRA